MPLPAFAEITFITLLGLVLGSFASAVAWREPRSISWGLVRSLCPGCKTNLTFVDLFPVLSWVRAGGKCRYCQQGISVRYPLIEISVALACLGVYSIWGLTPEGLAIIAATPFLAALFMIDIERMILPDRLILICALFGFLFLFLTGSTIWPLTMAAHGLAAVCYAFLVWGAGIVVARIKGKDALGLGDVKFFALAGLWLGLGYLPLYLMFSGVFGVILGAAWRFLFKKHLFPFGPALIASLYVCLLLKGVGFTLSNF